MHPGTGDDADPQAVDALLVRRGAAGDRRAFGELLARHDRALRRCIAARTRHAADTDDALQETVLKVWSNLGSLADPAKVVPWMLRIASREALRLVVARRAEHALAEQDAVVAGPDEHAEHLDAHRRLRAALDRLPDVQRRCWLLREVDGLSYRAIAERLALPESTVRGSLVAARRTVSTALRGSGWEPRPDVALARPAETAPQRPVASSSRSEPGSADPLQPPRGGAARVVRVVRVDPV